MTAMEEARDLIDRSNRIAVLTGAGISTDSGIPDFRGPNGVWTRDPRAEKMSNIDSWMTLPFLRSQTWQWLVSSPFRTAQPNIGHLSLVELERQNKLHTLVTQNIDGLHEAAGHDPSFVVEFHGTAKKAMCMGDIYRPWGGCGSIVPIEDVLLKVLNGDNDPPCESCGGIMKEATISFGQNISEENSRRATLAAQNCDLMLAVGTTLIVTPVANMVPVAKDSGARVIILNGSRTEYDDIADVVLRGSISEILPAITGYENES